MLSLGHIKKYLNYEFSSESELIKSITKISENFTTNRENIQEYLKTDKLVAAYTCFYLATNLPKLKKVLEKTQLDLGDYADCEFIDIGCGPGTFTLALLEINPDLKITCLETSKSMLKQARKLTQGIYPQAEITYLNAAHDLPPKSQKRFGIFGHSANEMDVGTIEKIIKQSDLDYILFIEPGTKDFFSKSLDIRDVLKEKFQIHYPCMSQDSCPMQGGEDDWCHQYLYIKHDADTERLTQLVHRDRRHLPIIINFFAKEESAINMKQARVIRSFPPTKFSLEWQLCEVDDEKNTLKHLQILMRGYKKAKIKEFQKVAAGDKITYSIDKIFDGKIRGKLDED